MTHWSPFSLFVKSTVLVVPYQKLLCCCSVYASATVKCFQFNEMERSRNLYYYYYYYHYHKYPRAHVHMVGMFRFSVTELAHSFLFSSCIYFCLYSPLNCISFHKFSR